MGIERARVVYKGAYTPILRPLMSSLSPPHETPLAPLPHRGPVTSACQENAKPYKGLHLQNPPGGVTRGHTCSEACWEEDASGGILSVACELG